MDGENGGTLCPFFKQYIVFVVPQGPSSYSAASGRGLLVHTFWKEGGDEAEGTVLLLPLSRLGALSTTTTTTQRVLRLSTFMHIAAPLPPHTSKPVFYFALKYYYYYYYILQISKKRGD